MGCLNSKDAPPANAGPTRAKRSVSEPAWERGIGAPEPSERSSQKRRRKRGKKAGADAESEFTSEAVSGKECYSEMTSDSTHTKKKKKKKKKKKNGEKSEMSKSEAVGDAPKMKDVGSGKPGAQGPSLHTPIPIADNTPQAPRLLEASVTNNDEERRKGSINTQKDSHGNPLTAAGRELSRSLSSQNSKRSKGSATRGSIPKGSLVGRMPGKKREDEMLSANKIASITAWIGEQPTELFKDPADFFRKDRQELKEGHPGATEG